MKLILISVSYTHLDVYKRQILYNAVSNRDFPTAQFCFLLSAALVVFANLISDIVNAAIDPRIREEGIQDA